MLRFLVNLGWILGVLVGAILAVAALDGIVTWVQHKRGDLFPPDFRLIRPPYMTALLDGPAQSQFHAGDIAFLHFERNRKAACYATTAMRILSFLGNDHSNRVIWVSLPTTRGLTEAGFVRSNVRVKLPPDLPPGGYALDLVGDYHCNNTEYQTALEPIEFDIIKQPSSGDSVRSGRVDAAD